MFKTISRGSTVTEYDTKKITIIDNMGYTYETEARLLIEDVCNYGVSFTLWIEVLIDDFFGNEEKWIELPTSRYLFDLGAYTEDENGNRIYDSIEDMYEEADRKLEALTVLDFTGQKKEAC